MEAEKKEVIKGFRMTRVEAEELSRRAREAGIRESDYLRLCLKSSPNDYPEVRILLRELINEVNHVGTNINQITKNNNSGIYVPEDKIRLIAYMKRLSSGMHKVVEEIGDMQDTTHQ